MPRLLRAWEILEGLARGAPSWTSSSSSSSSGTSSGEVPGGAYFTLTRILLRRSPGLGSPVAGDSGGGTSSPFQACSMISTILSCCLQCTSRLTMSGRSDATKA